MERIEVKVEKVIKIMIFAIASVIFILIHDCYMGREFNILKYIFLIIIEMIFWGINCLIFSGREKNRILIGGISFVYTFSFMGGELFVYPYNLQISFWSILIFLLDNIYFIPIAIMTLNVFNIEWKKVKKCEYSMSKTYIVYFCIIFGISVLYCIAFNPAIMYWDSYYQLGQAKGIIQYDDWHPLITTFGIQILLNICDNLSFVALVGAAFWAIIMAGVFTWFTKKTGRYFECIVLAILFAALPNQALATVTIFKDLIHVCCVVWITFIIIRILCEEKNCDKISIYVEIVICTFLLFCVRLNGMVVALVSLLTMWIIMKNRKKLLYSTVALIFLLFLYKGPILHSIEYKTYSPGLKYLALLNDMQVVYINGYDLPEDIEQFLERAQSSEELKPFISMYEGYVSNTADYDWIAENYSIVDFLSIYIRTFLEHPLILTRAVMVRNLVGWDISEQYGEVTIAGITQYTTGYHVAENMPYYGDRVENILTYFLGVLNDFCMRKPIKNILWRTGLFTVLLFSMIFNLISKKQYKMLYAFLPILGQILSLMLCVAWSNYRYFWPIYPCSILLLGYVLLGSNDDICG